jgi:N-acetylglucosaminyldiphosphoundecaprenol N-acetyl-beta-D-mannosaminyltransferase
MRVEICGTAVDAITAAQALDRIDAAVEAHRAGTLAVPLAVFSANVDMLVKAARDPVFARDLAAGDLLLADGVPLLWMARGLGARLPERVAGSDLLPLLAVRAARSGHSLFLLGAAPGIADQAAERLVREAPGLRIAGTLSPPSGFDRNPAERERVVEAVRLAAPDLVAVALGAPRQERWILEERSRLGAAVLLALGGTFDLVAGHRRRAPRLFQRAGLEWLWRLSQEPIRLGRRYLIEDAAIVPLYLRALWKRRARRRG